MYTLILGQDNGKNIDVHNHVDAHLNSMSNGHVYIKKRMPILIYENKILLPPLSATLLNVSELVQVHHAYI